jgi:Putative Actinobacterial Holin-X, holin superfamily III
VSIKDSPSARAEGTSRAVPPGEQTTAELIRGLAADANTLVRQEILLARQEVSEGLAKAAAASALLVAAGVLGLYALGFLLYTVAVAIGGPDWLGFAIVTVVLLLVVTVLVLIGRARLARAKVAPEQAKTELRATATELKEELRWGRRQETPPERSS